MRPSRRACGSCHDNVNFATGEGHADLPQISDNQCATCHTPEGELPFDRTIKVSLTDPAWTGFGIEAYLFAAVVYFVFERYLFVLLPRGRWTGF